MTPQEFKAWFDGFTEGLSGTPTKTQWARIKERVKEIDGRPVTPIYVERYWPYVTSACNYSTTTIPCSSTIFSNSQTTGFDGIATMNAVGKWESANLGITAT